jgi:signal transduction histidine kinase
VGTVALVIDLSAASAESDASERASDLARFASLLAHEVRNPLSAVKIALQTLERHGRLQPNDLRRAEIAIREVGNIELLLSEVLEFARPPTLSRVPIDPRGPVQEVASRLAVPWAERGVQVRCAVPERMVPVHADPTRVETAVRLLVRLGALAAEEAGGGEVLVSLSVIPRVAPRRSRRWILSVRDPGRALSVEARKQAFVPFNPSRARGSGLALAVVERIAREHGGSVRLSSLEGGGNLVEMEMAED